MKFRFCDKVYALSGNNIVVEIEGLSKEEEKQVESSLSPYIIKTDMVTSIKIDAKSFDDIKHFYKKCNKIKETIRGYIYQILLNEGWIRVHGSAVKLNDKTFLFIGDTKTGKSSSAFLCASRLNTSFVANDDVILHPKYPIIVGYPAGFGVARMVGDLMDIGKYCHIPSENSYWYTNEDMLNMGFSIEPCGKIARIVFPHFTKDPDTLTFCKNVDSEYAKNYIFENKKSSNTNIDDFKYIDDSMCLEVETSGICRDYEILLEKIVAGDKKKIEESIR